MITFVNKVYDRKDEFWMPAQWTADVIGEMHLKGFNQTELAAHMGVSRGYVNMVLQGKRDPKGAEEKFRRALREMEEQA